jgi:hypothetical protein
LSGAFFVCGGGGGKKTAAAMAAVEKQLAHRTSFGRKFGSIFGNFNSKMCIRFAM